MNKKYRKVIIAGNWKMNQLPSGVKPFVEELKTMLHKQTGAGAGQSGSRSGHG